MRQHLEILGGELGAEDCVEDVLVEKVERMIRGPRTEQGSLHVGVRLALLEPPKQAQAEVARQHDQARVDVRLSADRPVEVKHLLPARVVAIEAIGERDDLALRGDVEDGIERPRGDDVGVDEEHELVRLPERRDSLEEVWRGRALCLEDRRLAGQDLSLPRVEAAIEEDDGLVVSLKPERVDQGHGAQEMAPLDHGVDRERPS